MKTYSEKELKKQILKDTGKIITEDDIKDIHTINDVLNMSIEALDLVISYYVILLEQFKELCDIKYISLDDKDTCDRLKSTMDININHILELSKNNISKPESELINLISINKELIEIMKEKKYI